MEHDPLWYLADLATIVAKIIESIRLIHNATTKIKPLTFCSPLWQTSKHKTF